jgi:putative sterol carrier protein
MAVSTVQEVFERVALAKEDSVQGVSGVMLFDLGGEGGGKWTVVLNDGDVKLEEGETATPDVTFSMEAQDFVDIANGDLNPIGAFMQGKVKVSGDMTFAMQLQNILS